MDPQILRISSLSDMAESCPSELDPKGRFQAISALLSELTPGNPPATVEYVRRFLNLRGTLFLLVLDGRIIGMAMLSEAPDLNGFFGEVDNVVVSAEFRGRGYSKLLMDALIRTARTAGMEALVWTSRATRMEANGLYHKLGAASHPTNAYSLDLTGA